MLCSDSQYSFRFPLRVRQRSPNIHPEISCTAPPFHRNRNWLTRHSNATNWIVLINQLSFRDHFITLEYRYETGFFALSQPSCLNPYCKRSSVGLIDSIRSICRGRISCESIWFRWFYLNRAMTLRITVISIYLVDRKWLTCSKLIRILLDCPFLLDFGIDEKDRAKEEYFIRVCVTSGLATR